MNVAETLETGWWPCDADAEDGLVRCDKCGHDKRHGWVHPRANRWVCDECMRGLPTPGEALASYRETVADDWGAVIAGGVVTGLVAALVVLVAQWVLEL